MMGPPMNRDELESKVRIAHRDDHLLILEKPSGLPTTRPDEGPCLVRVARALDRDAELNHPTSRLDAEVSGLVTFARTRRANEALEEARARGDYRRLYLGLSPAPLPALPARVETEIGIDPRDPRRRLVNGGRDPKRAASRIAVRVETPHVALLELRPETGRTHQIRVHMASIGCPLYGDWLYGTADPAGLNRPALHAAQLAFEHPMTKMRITVSAPVPADMQALLSNEGMPNGILP